MIEFFRLNESAALLPITREKRTKQMVAIKNYCAVHECELSFPVFRVCLVHDEYAFTSID